MGLFRPASLLLCSFLIPGSVAAQQTPPRDPQAIVLASRALMVLTGGAAVNDVILTGTATRIAGSDRGTGTAVLKARGTEQSRIDLAITGGQRTEARSSSVAGYSSGPDGIWHPIPTHNCWTDAAWFFPPLSSLAALSNPNVLVWYVGHETRNGLAVEHLRFARYVSSRSAGTTQLIQRVSTIEMYLDSSSLLPLATTFNVHPDGDAATDIAVEVRFSDYRVVNGIRVAFRIQRIVQGGLTLDLSVALASLNNGLTSSDFAVR